MKFEFAALALCLGVFWSACGSGAATEATGSSSSANVKVDTSGWNSSSSTGSSSSILVQSLRHRAAYLGKWSIEYNALASEDFTPYSFKDTAVAPRGVDLFYSKGELSARGPDSTASKLVDLGSTVSFKSINNNELLLQLWQKNASKSASKLTLKQGNSYLVRNAGRSLLIFTVNSYDVDLDELLLDGSYYPALDPVQDSTQK